MSNYSVQFRAQKMLSLQIVLEKLTANFRTVWELMMIAIVKLLDIATGRFLLDSSSKTRRQRLCSESVRNLSRQLYFKFNFDSVCSRTTKGFGI